VGARLFVLGMVFRRLRGWRSDIGLEAGRTVVVLEVLLRNTIEGERGNGAVTTWSGDAPGAMGAGPTGEVVPFEPDQAFTHAVVRQNVARATLQRLLSTWRNAFGLDSRLIGGGRELLPESVDGQRLRLGSDKRERAWSLAK
jgi:hypothetical protein